VTRGQSGAVASAGVTPSRDASPSTEMRFLGSFHPLDDFDVDSEAAAAESLELIRVVNQLQRQQLKRTLPQQIAEKLSQRILLGLIQPESRLIEQHIVDEFDVSNGPAREALRLLAAEGLVTIQSHRGALVTQMSREDIRDVFDIRMALWGIAVRRACEKNDPALVDLAQSAAKTLGSDDMADSTGAAYMKVSLGAFVQLALATENWRLCELLRQSALPVILYSRVKFMFSDLRRQSCNSWKRLAEAMKQGDADAAEKISRELIGMTAYAILSKFD
jgi:DNA-binding GntR family transcriptional regulator